MIRHSAVLLALLVSFATGCRTVSRPPGGPGPAPGDIYLSPSGRSVSFDALLERVRRDRVVYVGETHDNDQQHAFQTRVVRAMYEQDPRLLIGMEMFQRPFQPALDRFIAGETTEWEFLEESEYFTRWRWDWRYYRDILLFARERKIPVIALNSPAEANRRVSRGGGLSALTPEDRKWVAEEIDLTIEPHREFVMKVLENHPTREGFDKEAFYASQCLWEDTMAESVARALAARPGYRMVVLAGGGHVQQRFGVPLRAERRGARPYSILLGMSVSPEDEPLSLSELLAEDLGDALFFTEPSPEVPPSPKLGVMVDEESPGRGVAVKEVTTGGLADLAGMAAGDRIVALCGRRVDDLEDLRIALALHEERMGTVTVLRGGEERALAFDTAWALP